MHPPWRLNESCTSDIFFSLTNRVGLALPIPSDPFPSLKMASRAHLLELILRASKNQSIMSGQSLFCLKDVPASDCSKRQQQLRAHHCAAVAVGIYLNRWYVLFLSGGRGCRTTHGKSAPSLGNIGFSWVLRFVKGLPVCLTRRHPTACGRLLQAHMGRPRSLHSLPHRQWYWRRIWESWR